MKLTWCFMTSAVLHAMILILPFPDLRGGEQVTIPVSLVIEQIGIPKGQIPKGKDPIGGARTHPEVTSNPQGPTTETRRDETNESRFPEETVATVIKSGPPSLPKMELAKKKTIEEPGAPELDRTGSPNPKALSTEGTKVNLATTAYEASGNNQISSTTGAAGSSKNQAEGENPEESDEAHIQASLKDWHLLEPLEEGPIQEPMIEAASVGLPLKPENTTTGFLPPGEDLDGPTDAMITPGEDVRDSPFVQATYAHIVKPEYPGQARRKGWEGTTVLRILVDQRGNSKRIEVNRSSGFEILDQAAVEAVKHWQFHPARNAVGPVESWVKVPIVFSLVDRNQGSSLATR